MTACEQAVLRELLLACIAEAREIQASIDRIADTIDERDERTAPARPKVKARASAGVVSLDDYRGGRAS